MGLLSRIFRKAPEKKGPRKMACIQCGSILPDHVNWCPRSEQSKAKAAARAS